LPSLYLHFFNPNRVVSLHHHPPARVTCAARDAIALLVPHGVSLGGVRRNQFITNACKNNTACVASRLETANGDSRSGGPQPRETLAIDPDLVAA
jgi:hypothetical protein